MFNVAQRGGCSAGVAQQRTVLKALLKGRQAHALSAIFLTALCCSVPLWRRLAWVVGFTMGPFGTLERPWKPFNPVSSIQAARGQQRRRIALRARARSWTRRVSGRTVHKHDAGRYRYKEEKPVNEDRMEGRTR